jgi:hypothetical protein
MSKGAAEFVWMMMVWGARPGYLFASEKGESSAMFLCRGAEFSSVLFVTTVSTFEGNQV